MRVNMHAQIQGDWLVIENCDLHQSIMQELLEMMTKVTTAENDLSRAPLRPAEGAATSGKPSQNG